MSEWLQHAEISQGVTLYREDRRKVETGKTGEVADVGDQMQ